MKLKSKFLLCTSLLFLVVIINGCEVSQDKRNIYDDNDRIAQQGDSFSYSTRTDTEDSNDKIDVKYSGFYGTDTIWNFDSKEDGEITIKYDSVVNSGDFKAVLINTKNEVNNILTKNQQGEKTIKLSQGKYIFKIVGRNAKGEIKVSINKSQNVEITKVIKKS
ncbi:MAG: hypothetical protein ABRQ27_07795 [Clostridiaceae bacterium]